MGYMKSRAEEIDARGFGPVEEALCVSHIADRYLVDHLISERVSGACFLCDRHANDLVALESILHAMMRVIRRDMEPAAGRPWPVFDTIEVLYHYFDDLFDVDDPVEIFTKLSDVIEIDGWDLLYPGGDFERMTPAAGWRQFSELVQHSSRFIFVKPGAMTRMPDGGIHAARFVEDFREILDRNASNLVNVLVAGTVVYRGRLVDGPHDAERVANAAALGATPPGLAGANRMSPAGISMFYASGDADTAAQEIGAHDDKQREHAVIGGFRLLRDARVLDLTGIQLPSVFDEDRVTERGDLAFVRGFETDITRPIRLDGREHREYAPTQVLTELIRWSSAPDVDGIKLRSAQSGRDTYVLFFEHGSAADATPNNNTNSFDDKVMFTLDRGDVQLLRLKRKITSSPIPFWP